VWSFPNLEYLAIDLRNYCIDDNIELTTFESMPKLRTVVLYQVVAYIDLNVDLPWAQLTSLSIEPITESLFRIVISECPALETGNFSIGCREIDEELPIVDITLTHLKTFSIQFAGESDPSIFDGIHFPALDVFKSWDSSSFNWTAPEHIFRQLAPITTLSLTGYIDSLDRIDKMLCETKNVTTFEVGFANGYEEVLKALTLGEEEREEVLLPKLDVLRVQLCSNDHYEPSAVVDFVKMVASRSPSGAAPFGVAPLQEVWVEEPVGPVNTLKTDLDAVPEQWRHKTDRPQVRYEKREW